VPRRHSSGGAIWTRNCRDLKGLGGSQQFNIARTQPTGVKSASASRKIRHSMSAENNFPDELTRTHRAIHIANLIELPFLRNRRYFLSSKVSSNYRSVRPVMPGCFNMGDPMESIILRIFAGVMLSGLGGCLNLGHVSTPATAPSASGPEVLTDYEKSPTILKRSASRLSNVVDPISSLESRPSFSRSDSSAATGGIRPSSTHNPSALLPASAPGLREVSDRSTSAEQERLRDQDPKVRGGSSTKHQDSRTVFERTEAVNLRAMHSICDGC
jgi:hypothetical protein